MKGAIGNAFILNMVITFIVIFFMLLIGSVAYSKAYKTNKFLVDSLVDYVEYFNTVDNQKDICFSNCSKKIEKNWNDIVNEYLGKSGYILSSRNNSCPKTTGKNEKGNSVDVYPNDEGYILKRDSKIGDYEYCIYQKRYYELNETDDFFSKRRYSYKVVSYMKFDFPIIGEFMKLPIVSETKVIVNYKNIGD